jgi:hypothetical protein
MTLTAPSECLFRCRDKETEHVTILGVPATQMRR